MGLGMTIRGGQSSILARRSGGQHHQCPLSTNAPAQDKMWDIMNFEPRPKEKKQLTQAVKPKETRRIGAIALKVSYCMYVGSSSRVS